MPGSVNRANHKREQYEPFSEIGVHPGGDHTAYDDQRFFAKFSYDFSDDTRITFSGNFAETATEMGYTTFLSEPREEDTDHRFYSLTGDARTVVKNRIDPDLTICCSSVESESMAPLSGSIISYSTIPYFRFAWSMTAAPGIQGH